MRKVLILPVFAVLITVLSFLPQDAAAATSYELQVGDTNGACETIGGIWSTGICNLSTPSMALNIGDSLTIDSGVTFTFTGFFKNSGVIINHGTFNNYGLIT